MRAIEAARLLARAQAGYYLVTGVWPLVDIRSFEAISGPKVDRWLVKTVGALVATTGAALAVAHRRRRFPPELVLVAAGNAMSLATIDVVYAARRRISQIYLLDAVLELAFVAAWVAFWKRGAAGDGHGR